MDRTISIALRKVLEDLHQKHGKLFQLSIEEDGTVQLSDKVAGSDFFFEIKEKAHNGKPYTMRFKPHNRNNFNPTTAYGSFDNIKANIQNWVSLLKEYNQPSPIFEDQNIQYYYDQLESDFEIIDPEDETPFSIEDQRKIREFLDKLVECSKDESEEIQADVKNEVDTIKSNLSASTKGESGTRIRKLFAKVYSKRFELAEKFLIQFTTTFGTQILLN